MRGVFRESPIGTVAATAAVAALVLLSSGCDKLKARDNLNKGVNSFRSGQYTAAADDFKTAIDLDPNLADARLYLATAYMQQWVPGSEGADNVRNMNAALQEYQKALTSNLDDKHKLIAMQSLASIYFQKKDFAKSEEWYKKVIAADPKNKEAYYTLGVIAWSEFVPAQREARVSLSMRPEEPGPLKEPAAAKGKKGAPVPSSQKADLKAKYWASLTEGIEDEKKALEIDPEYEYAMAYMNLLIRYRADLDDTREQYDADAKEADNWVQKNLETRKKKDARKAAAAEQTQ